VSVTVVTDTDRVDPDALAALYRSYEWWADRDRDRVETALAETDAFVGLRVAGELVASARVLTDFTYYGTVYDVVVAAGRRGEGLGERLLREVQNHPDLGSLPGLTLLCREGLVEFYESVGFERADDAVDHPDGDPEPLVQMKTVFDEQPPLGGGAEQKTGTALRGAVAVRLLEVRDDVVALGHPLDAVFLVDQHRDAGLAADGLDRLALGVRPGHHVGLVVETELVEFALDLRTVRTALEFVQFQGRHRGSLAAPVA
jgi:predicted GNAT family N-acyltransferase